MKLSKKGLMRLLDVAFDGDEFYQSNALQIEFEPDDFVGGCCQNGKDHVTLTLDEVKELANKLKHNAEFFFLQTGEFDYDTDELWQCLTDKIEQAEN